MSERTLPVFPVASSHDAPALLAGATASDAVDPSLAESAPALTAAKPARLEPTRYGDWELNGKCVDF